MIAVSGPEQPEGGPASHEPAPDDATTKQRLIAPDDITRAEIEALVGTLRAGETLPSWALRPSSELEFAAALVGRTPGVTAVYDDDDVLVGYHGIRLRRDAS